MKNEIIDRPKEKVLLKSHMKTAIIVAPKKIDLQQQKLPEIQENEVLIRLKGCGVCASNLPVWQGREWFEYPIEPGKPGHEPWGIIEAVGKNIDKKYIGKTVTGLTYNAFAEYDIARFDEVVVIPEQLAEKPFPGEPMACVMNIFERSEINSQDRVVVIGCGFLGLSLIQLLKSEGCEVIAISRRAFSLEMAKEFGADKVIPLNDHQEIIDVVKDFSQGEFCDKTIECTGKEWPLNLAIELTKIRGKLIVAGFHQDGMRSVNVQMMNWKGLDMINAHERDPQKYISGIRRAIEAIENEKYDPFALLTHQFSLEELDLALNCLEERPEGFIKGIIKYENHD